MLSECVAEEPETAADDAADLVAVDEKGSAARRYARLRLHGASDFTPPEAAEMSSDEIFNRACQAEASRSQNSRFSSTRTPRINPADADAATNLGWFPCLSAASTPRQRPPRRTRPSRPATHRGAAAARRRPHLWRARSSIIRPGCQHTCSASCCLIRLQPDERTRVWRQSRRRRRSTDRQRVLSQSARNRRAARFRPPSAPPPLPLWPRARPLCRGRRARRQNPPAPAGTRAAAAQRWIQGGRADPGLSLGAGVAARASVSVRADRHRLGPQVAPAAADHSHAGRRRQPRAPVRGAARQRRRVLDLCAGSESKASSPRSPARRWWSPLTSTRARSGSAPSTPR